MIMMRNIILWIFRTRLTKREEDIAAGAGTETEGEIETGAGTGGRGEETGEAGTGGIKRRILNHQVHNANKNSNESRMFFDICCA